MSQTNTPRVDASNRLGTEPVGKLLPTDIAKIAVVERHSNMGNVGLGLIRGYGIKHGAIATTVAHDSHNIITVGTNDSDMAMAVQRIESLCGGVVLVKNGVILDLWAGF